MILTVKPVESTDKMIQENTIAILILAAILFVFAAVLVLLIASRIGRAVRRAGRLLDDISQGDLTVSIDKKMMKRKDELGLMAKALRGLMDELHNFLADLKNSSIVLSEAGQELNNFAGNTKITVNEVTMAVEDISQGALTQVEDFEKATQQVNNMGTTIDQIVEEVGVLYQTSESMELSKGEAEGIIEELSASSEKTYEAVKMIENQVNLTDESVNKIQESVKLISSIAEETNLLSLNASIEAARKPGMPARALALWRQRSRNWQRNQTVRRLRSVKSSAIWRQSPGIRWTPWSICTISSMNSSRSSARREGNSRMSAMVSSPP